VQGLHRFYRSRSEIVVASWMTKQDRELAIGDNIDYVRRAVESFGGYERLVFLRLLPRGGDGVSRGCRRSDAMAS